LLQDIKNTVKQSAIYGLSRISTKLVAFILLPIITLNLNVSEYGIYVLTESLWQILWAVFLFGLESGIVRWYLEIKELNTRKKFLFSVMLFVFILNLTLFIIIFASSGLLSNFIYDNPDYKIFVIYSALIASAETFAFIIFLLLRIEEKAKMYSVFAVTSTLISLILQIYFLQFTQIKLEGIFISKIISPLFIIIILIPYLIKHIKPGFEKTFLFELVKYSFPVMIASFVITLLNQADRYILGYLTNMNNVGIYGLAYNISGLINFLIISPFTLAFTVISWKKLNDENAKRFFTKTTTYLFFTVIYISLVIALFTPHLIKIFTLRTEYWEASKYVPWIILAMPFYGIHFIGIFSFYVTKNTKFVLLSYLAALFVNIALNFLIIPHFEIFGACIVNIFSFIVLSIVIYYFSKSNYFFKYEWNKILILALCYLLFTIPFFYFNFENRILEIILKLFAIVSFPVLLYFTNFFEQIEKIRIKGFINKYLFKIKV
jgi:O-antigen/teichoic acid export membrane protein